MRVDENCSISWFNFIFVVYFFKLLFLFFLRCRHDPSLIEVLKFYNEYCNSKHLLSSPFNEDWQHYKNVGLPPSK